MPVMFVDGKPFTIAWTDVDIHGAEVVVLLVTWKEEAACAR